MPKTKYFSCFYHSVLFFFPKRCHIKFNTLFDYENNNRKELQNIATNHLADNDYKDFMEIYGEYTRKPYSILATDTTLPSSDPLRFRTNLCSSYEDDSN